jgi:hypothetical protein
MVLVVTAAYTLHAVIDQPPDCNCFGEWLSYKSGVQEANKLLGRNILLMAALLCGLLGHKEGNAKTGSEVQ